MMISICMCVHVYGGERERHQGLNQRSFTEKKICTPCLAEGTETYLQSAYEYGYLWLTLNISIKGRIHFLVSLIHNL